MESAITCGFSISKEVASISLWVEDTTQGGQILKAEVTRWLQWG